jgi:hypothetical protein
MIIPEKPARKNKELHIKGCTLLVIKESIKNIKKMGEKVKILNAILLPMDLISRF